MPALLLFLLAAAGDDAALAATVRKPLVETPCAIDPDTTDITVCGRRRADRFRVPFLVAEAGDPRREGVWAERTRLLNRSNPVRDLSPFLVGGGFTGVTASTRGGVTGATNRPLAP